MTDAHAWVDGSGHGGWGAVIVTDDKFTIPGHYKRHSFWQWITRKPRELQIYGILGDATAGGFVEYQPVTNPVERT